jgi:hypothetical protein
MARLPGSRAIASFFDRGRAPPAGAKSDAARLRVRPPRPVGVRQHAERDHREPLR